MMVYINDNIGERLKNTAARNKRQVSALVEILLDFADMYSIYQKNRGPLKPNNQLKGDDTDGQKILEA